MRLPDDGMAFSMSGRSAAARALTANPTAAADPKRMALRRERERRSAFMGAGAGLGVECQGNRDRPGGSVARLLVDNIVQRFAGGKPSKVLAQQRPAAFGRDLRMARD